MSRFLLGFIPFCGPLRQFGVRRETVFPVAGRSRRVSVQWTYLGLDAARQARGERGSAVVFGLWDSGKEELFAFGNVEDANSAYCRVRLNRDVG